MRVTIIGSGIAGLACAVRMASAGHQVDVFEANAVPGGKLGEINLKGYRFDSGPSLLTLPNLVDELFTLTGRKPTDYLSYIRNDRLCNYFYEDGTSFTAYTDKEKFAEELKAKIGFSKPAPLFRYLDRALLKYKLTGPLFLERSLHRIKSFLNKETLHAILNYFKLDLSKTMNQVNEKAFKNHYLVQYFNRYATYNGSNPYKAPGILTMIPALEHHYGAYFPAQGMYSITKALHKLAAELGVNFHFNSKVSKIVTDDSTGKKIVKGIVCNNTLFEADIVVSNADIVPTYRQLLAHEKAPEEILSQKKSSSAIVFYWGIKKQFPELDLHNILFTDDYKTEFEQLFNYKNIFYDATIYINITSKLKPDDAPPGCENWFVMINAPNNNGQNWDQLVVDARKYIITKINRMLKTDITAFIEAEDILEPRIIEARTSSSAGALYGSSSNNKKAAFRRHKNFSKSIKGLYFCGGSVHPGGGIPLCLNSAKIVSELIADDFK